MVRLSFMKTLLTLCFVLLLCEAAFPQQKNLDLFNQRRQQINKKGLLAIGSWSAANIVYGTIASSQTHGSTKYFHRMNAIWNGVTLGLSAFGYFSAKKEAGLNFTQSLKQQSSIEKVFLANVGIDVAYIAGGLYMRERAKTSAKNPERSQGYGESVMLQGSVLLMFDALMYVLHQYHGKQLYKMAEKVNISSTENGVGFVVKL